MFPCSAQQSVSLIQIKNANHGVQWFSLLWPVLPHIFPDPTFHFLPAIASLCLLPQPLPFLLLVSISTSPVGCLDVSPPIYFSFYLFVSHLLFFIFYFLHPSVFPSRQCPFPFHIYTDMSISPHFLCNVGFTSSLIALQVFPSPSS